MKTHHTSWLMISALFAAAPLVGNTVSAQSGYTIEQVTTGSANHRAPGINNLGEIVWMEETSQGQQVFSSTRGQLTSPSGNYTEAHYPTIADNGSFVCFRPGSLPCAGSGYLLRYPGESTVEFCSRNGAQHRDPLPQAGISSDGRVIWARAFYGTGGILSTRKFFVDGTEVSLPSTLVNWQNPSINRHGEYVYDLSGQVISSRRGALIPGANPAINDRGEVAYVSQGEIQVLCRSGEIARIVGAGSAPSLNAKGVVAFERQVNGVYQIIRATPAECEVCLTHFFQTDARWGSDPYDHIQKTIRQRGCAMTCLSMGLNYAGLNIDPGQLNLFMTRNTGNYDRAGNVNWVTTVQEVSGTEMRWNDRRINSADNPSGASQYLEDVVCNQGYPVIVGVKTTTRTVQGRTVATFPSHFVLVVGKQGNQFLIADPGYQANTTLDAYPKYETRGYVERIGGLGSLLAFAPAGREDANSTSSTVSRLAIAASGNISVLVTDPFGRMTGFDLMNGSRMENIPRSTIIEDALADDDTGDAPTEVSQFVYCDQPAPGKYQITVTGVGAGVFTLRSQSFYEGTNSLVPLDIQGTLAEGESVTNLVAVGTGLGIRRLPNSHIALQLVSDRTNEFRLEASQNLSNWTSLVTFSLTNCLFDFTDTNSPSLNQRFYRAVKVKGSPISVSGPQH